MIPEMSVAQRYEAEVNPDELDSHGRVMRLVSPGSNVLDLGCATGALGVALKERGCRVVGVEVDAEAAGIARSRLDAVYELDLSSDELTPLVGDSPFDVVIAADLLEHLASPHLLLRQLPSLMTPDGILITSIPNVAHGSVRVALLEGQFPYHETGLLDRTHLRFFTRNSMSAMLAEGGFQVVYVEDRVIPWQYGEVLDGVDVESLPVQVREAVEDDPECQVYQFIAVSTAGAPVGLAAALARQSEESAVAQYLEAARAESHARGLRVAELEAQVVERDRHVDQLAGRLQQLESQLGTLVEAAAASQKLQADLFAARRDKERLRDSAADAMTRLRNEIAAQTEVRRQLSEAQTNAAHWEARCHDALCDAQAARASLTWRVGALLLFPFAVVRTKLRRRT